MSTGKEREFRRRHDFYYITIIVYVVFAIAYILVTGTVTNETVEFGFRDPVVYIIGAFILYALLMLAVNMSRSPRLVITDSALIFRTRFRERIIPFTQIRHIVIKRERRKFNDGSFAVVKLRIASRRRGFRIRVANYERESELLEQFRTIAERIS